MSRADDNGGAQMATRKYCVSGCGFFGDPAKADMCSKCFREAVAKGLVPQFAGAGATSTSAAPVANPSAAVVTAPAGSTGIAPVVPVFTPARAAGSASGGVDADVTMSEVPPPLVPVRVAPSTGEGAGSGGAGDAVMTTGAAMLAAINAAAASTPASGSDTSAATPSGTSAQKNRSRCHKCNKKVGLTGFECRCKFVFCGDHRYTESHECPFDYKAMERAALTKANQKVVGERVDKL